VKRSAGRAIVKVIGENTIELLHNNEEAVD
jgi:hypothetical protein